MPTLPASTDFTGSGITEAQFKTAITNLRGFLADLLGAAGTQAAAQVALQALLGAGVDARSGAYTVVAGDRGKLINATGTWTLALTAAATLGAGFAFAIRNSGAGVITIDPNSSEQIDGATTMSVGAGTSALLVCTGSAWVTVGGGVGEAQIEGKHIKPISAFPPITVSAANTVSVTDMHSITVGTTTTTSSTYVVARTIVVGNLITGSVRYTLSHHNSELGGESSLQVKKNGVVVGGPWTTTSRSATARSVDITVVPADVITWEHKRGAMTTNQSAVSNPSETASDKYVSFAVYGKHSEL